MARYQVLTNKGTQEGDVFIDSKKKLVILGSAFEDSTGKSYDEDRDRRANKEKGSNVRR